MGFTDKLKNLGGKAKGKALSIGGRAKGKAKDWLKEKWGIGSLQTSPPPPPKPDSLDYLRSLLKQQQQTPPPPPPPEKGPTPGQKEEAPEKEGEEHAGGKGIGFNTKNMGKKIGGIIVSGIMMVAAYGGAFMYRPEFVPIVFIVGGIAMAFIIISMFLKNAGGWLMLGFLAVAGFALYYTHTIDPFIPQLEVYAAPVIDVYNKGMELVDNGYNFFQCAFGMTAGMDLQKCMESRKTNQTESVNKLGPVETLELNWGRKMDSTYDYDLPEDQSPYSLDITLVNKNSKIYKINITDIKASTTTGGDSSTEIPGSYFKQYEEYVLEPNEELPVRIKFDKIGECTSSKTFNVNITTKQTSGGWSDFGIAPSDEDKYKKFVHGFNPHITAEPGPLNIYVYTDPYGIDAKTFSDNSEPFEVIIKIQNTLKTGTANISELHLIQEFEVPQQLFKIDETTCHFTSGIKSGTGGTTGTVLDPVYPSCKCEQQGNQFKCNSDCAPNKIGIVCGGWLYGGAAILNPEVCNSTSTINGTTIYDATWEKSASGICSSPNSNCISLKFTTALIIKPNKKIAISCNASVENIPEYEYTDQIRVYADFNYIQEWSKPIPCAT
jgi:hypothetical protein